jgi:hypothetical protein
VLRLKPIRAFEYPGAALGPGSADRRAHGAETGPSMPSSPGWPEIIRPHIFQRHQPDLVVALPKLAIVRTLLIEGGPRLCLDRRIVVAVPEAREHRQPRWVGRGHEKHTLHECRHAGPLAGINLGLFHLLDQGLTRAADLGGDRHDRCPAGGMFMLVIQNQPHGTLAHFRGELVRRLAHDGSTFSGVGASGKPGTVQFRYRCGCVLDGVRLHRSPG